MSVDLEHIKIYFLFTLTSRVATLCSDVRNLIIIIAKQNHGHLKEFLLKSLSFKN